MGRFWGRRVVIWGDTFGHSTITQTGGSLSAAYGWVNNTTPVQTAVYEQSGGTASFHKRTGLFSGIGYAATGGHLRLHALGGSLQANKCIVAGRRDSLSMFRQTGGLARRGLSLSALDEFRGVDAMN